MLLRNQLTRCFPWRSCCTLRKHPCCTTRSRSWQGILLLHLDLARHSLCQQARSSSGSKHRAEHSQPPHRISPAAPPGPWDTRVSAALPGEIENKSATFSLEHGSHHSASQTFKLPGVNAGTGSERAEPLMAFLSSAVHFLSFSHPLP